MRDPIVRGEGLTPSERRLAALADRTFLRLWSYPNTFNDRSLPSCGTGQELCDLLAVFEDHVVIFSDKDIGWQAGKAPNLAWARWYRKAVDGAVAQLKGAERWLDRHAERIFTDARCTQPLPVPLPSPERRITHLVAVAGGAEAACRRFFGAPRGTFMIQPAVRGASHVDPQREGFLPFTIGDVNPGGTFVHVFDPTGLDIVMRELDTVTDFTAYLVRRARFLRTGSLAIATGEEHLLAAYMMNGFIDGRPGFLPEKLRKRARSRAVIIPENEYETYTGSVLYEQLESSRAYSRQWDNLIELISEDALAGTSIRILDQEPSLEMSEGALRVMASETRMDRVSLAHALSGAMTACLDQDLNRLIRRALIDRRKPSRRIGYVFLMLPQDRSAGSYADYRVYRSRMLETYAYALFREQARLDLVVAIALDIAREGDEIRTHSEDVLALSPPDWTPDLLQTFEANRKAFGLKDPGELQAVRSKRRIKNPFRVKGHAIGE